MKTGFKRVESGMTAKTNAQSEGDSMGTFTKKGLTPRLPGTAIWGLVFVVSTLGVSCVWGQGISGPPPPYRGRLVINYPLLNSILLILILIAVLGAAWILRQLFTAKLKTFENRIAYLEYTVKDLYARQKEELDGLLRQIHNLPGKAKRSEAKRDLEKDTTVGKSPLPSEPNSFEDP
jgi:hypothetical protein